MVLKRPFVGDTAKPLHLCSGLPGDRVHWVDVVVLLRRYSCKGHVGMLLYIFSGLQKADLIKLI